MGDYTPQDPSYSDSNLQGMPQDTSYQTGFQNMGGYTAPNPPYSDPNLQGMPQNASFPYQSAPVPQQKKKKGLKWWHILLIGLGCILIFSIISAVSGDDKETDKSDNNFVLDNNIQFNGDKKIEYTKGTLDSNGTYTNEWLGITIDMPDGYVNGNEEQYASFENGGNTDCGFYAVSIYGEIVSVMFEDVSSVFGITEKQYLDILAEQLKQENTYGIEYSYPDSYGTMTIAGEIYKSAHFGLTAFDGSEMTQSFYVLKKDGRMCGIFIMGNSADENDTMARSIKKLY